MLQAKKGKNAQNKTSPNDQNEDIDVFTNEKKKQQLLNALQGNEEIKQKVA